MAAPAIRDKVAKSAMLLGSMRLVGRSLDLITLVVLTRILLPADFGIVALALSIMQVAEAVLENPVGQVLLRLRAVKHSHLDTAFTISLIRGVAISTILLLVSVPFAHFYGDERLVGLICAMGLSPAFRGLRSQKLMLQYRRLRFYADGLSELAGKLGATIVATIVALQTHSYWAIAAGTITSPLINAVVTYILVPHRPRITLVHWQLFHGYVGWNIAGQSVSALNWQADRLVLGRMVSHSALGLYTTAREFAAITYKALFETLQRPLYSALAAASRDPARLKAVYANAVAAALSFMLPIAIGQALVTPELVYLFLGERWIEAVPLLQICSLTLIPGIYSSLTGNLFVASGRPDLLFKRNLLDFALRIPVSVILIKLYGIYGALAAVVLADVFLAAVCMRSANKLVGLSVTAQLGAAGRGLLSSAVMVGIIMIARNFTPQSDSIVAAITNLAVIVPAAAVGYVSVHLLAWVAAGRPNGIEEVGLRIVRQSLARFRKSPALSLAK